MVKADDSINDYAQFDYDFLDIPKFEKSRNRMHAGGAQEALGRDGLQGGHVESQKRPLRHGTPRGGEARLAAQGLRHGSHRPGRRPRLYRRRASASVGRGRRGVQALHGAEAVGQLVSSGVSAPGHGRWRAVRAPAQDVDALRGALRAALHSKKFSGAE